jgi:putative SOS response-associated peptidase YedK
VGPDPLLGEGREDRPIDARAEKVDTKPAFREAFRQRRCLEAVENFYEWKKAAKGKQPMPSGGRVVYAGVASSPDQRRAQTSSGCWTDFALVPRVSR